MPDICYLCGLPITDGQPRSNDHVVPSTLITRTQPKAKGFDYGSYLPTHEVCNNRFGNETYVAKALDLLGVLDESQVDSPLQHRTHAEISILPIDASKLSHFTDRDIKFFKIIDAREADVAAFSDPSFYAGHVKTNPTRDALLVSLSVLAKSAAALLVKRHMKAVPRLWRIYAQAYAGDLTTLDFSELLGETKPFDSNLRAWVIELPDNNWHVIYAAKGMLVFFTFAFSDRARLLRELMDAHADADTLKFLGSSINEILTSGWTKV
jgi:hypothetical protein